MGVKDITHCSMLQGPFCARSAENTSALGTWLSSFGSSTHGVAAANAVKMSGSISSGSAKMDVISLLLLLLLQIREAPVPQSIFT